MLSASVRSAPGASAATWLWRVVGLRGLTLVGQPGRRLGDPGRLQRRGQVVRLFEGLTHRRSSAIGIENDP